MISLMNKKILNVKVYFWILFLLASAIFILFPQIDLYISSLFYDGESFAFKRTWLEQLFFHSIKPIIITLALGSIAIFIFNFFKKKNILNINAKVILYLLLVLGIAPGLIVNATLKENWGRARPHQTTDFGGSKEFTPAFIPSNQGGYSFSSGHSAAAFSLIGFVILANRRKKLWMTLILSYATLMSLVRVAAGGHFFSDTVTSFFIVIISTSIIHMMIFKDEEKQ